MLISFFLLFIHSLIYILHVKLTCQTSMLCNDYTELKSMENLLNPLYQLSQVQTQRAHVIQVNTNLCRFRAIVCSKNQSIPALSSSVRTISRQMERCSNLIYQLKFCERTSNLHICCSFFFLFSFYFFAPEQHVTFSSQSNV